MSWGSSPESTEHESAHQSRALGSGSGEHLVLNRPIRTLLVEDDPTTAEMMQRVLENGRGSPRFEVTVSLRGAPAVLLARRMRFEATLIDVQLPDVLGLEVAAKIGQHDPDIAQLLYTGHDVTLEQLAEARRTGTIGIVTKPIDSKTIANILRSNVLGFRHAPRVLGYGPVRIFTHVQALVIDGELRVFANEDALQHRLLVGLALASGEVVPRADLLAYVYQLDDEALRRYREQYPDSDRLGQLVYRARARLVRDNEWRLKTWRNVGYSLGLDSIAAD